MAQSIGTVLIDIKANTQELIQGFDRAEKRVNSSISTMKTSIVGLTSAYLSFNAVLGGGKFFLQQAEALTNTTSRLKLVTSSSQELLSIQKQLFELSNKAKVGYLETVDLYTNITTATENYNIEQEKLLIVTDAISKATVVSGASVAEAKRALIQLGQAFTKDFKNVGQDLNSINEQTPRVFKAISDGLGITTSQFRKMASEGKLSTEIIINALINSKDKIDSEFTSMTTTIGQELNLLSNQTIKLIENIDEKFEISSTTIAGIEKLTTSIESIGKTIDSLSSAEIENIITQFKNMGIAVVGSYVALKSAKAVYSGYTSVVAFSNKIQQQNIDLENSKAKAYSDGMKALYARKIADEALNTGMLNGVALSKKKIDSLEKEAVRLEIASKKQMAYSYQLEATKTRFDAAAVGAYALRTAMSAIPFMIISAGITSIATSIFTASKNTEIWEKTISSTREELEKLTSVQIEARIILADDEIKKQAKEVGKLFDMTQDAYYETFASWIDRGKAKSLNLAKVQDEVDKLEIILNRRKDLNDILEKQKNPKIAEVKKEKNIASEEIEKTQKEIDALNKAYLEIAQIGMSDYQKSLLGITTQTQSWIDSGVNLNESLKAQSLLLDELNSKKAIDDTKENLTYYERLIQLQTDSYEKEVELANISYANRLLGIESSNKPIEDKQRLLELETQIYEKTLARVQTENNIKNIEDEFETYNSMLEAQLRLNEATSDWNSNLTGTSAALADVSTAMSKLGKVTLVNLQEEAKLKAKYDKDKEKYKDNFKKLDEIELKYAKDKGELEKSNTNAMLKGYSDLAGAMSTLFKDGNKEAAALQIAQTSLALVEGTRAVIKQAADGDPYTASARMVAMAAMVAPLLKNIGVMFGMNKNTETWDEFSKQEANSGIGSLLGDSKKASDSLNNSLNTLKDFAQPQFKVLSDMNKAVQNINNQIGGVAKLLINNSDFAIGKNYQGIDTGWKNNSISNALDKFDNQIGSFLGNDLKKVFDVSGFGLINKSLGKLAGGLFGKKSTKVSLHDSGLTFDALDLQDALDGIEGKQYQVNKREVKKKSWFGSSSKTYYDSYFQELDKETNRQFTLVVNSLYDTVLQSGEALDVASNETAKNLGNFVVNLGKISLKDKTGEEIQELLGNVFSKLGDDLAKTAFPLLDDFQAIGEGMFETLTRVASGMQESKFYIARLGKDFEEVNYKNIENKQGNVGFEALFQSISKFEESTYPLNNNLMLILQSSKESADELYSLYTNLDTLRDRIKFLGHDIQGLSNDMIMGAGSLDSLQDGFNAYFEKFLDKDEQLLFKTEQLTKQFDSLGVALPTSKDGFKDLLDSLDLTTSSGQELYGRLIVLSKTFAEVSDETTAAIDELNSVNLDGFLNQIDKISGTLNSLKDTALGFINSFDNSSLDLQGNLISYNQKRAEFESYFENGALKEDADFNRTKTLYQELSNLGKNIAKEDNNLKNSLINQFQSDITDFDFANDVIKVNIVDGLAPLIDLSLQQSSSLKDIFNNNALTTDELFKNVASYLDFNNTDTSYNETALLMLERLSPYMKNDISKILEDIRVQASKNRLLKLNSYAVGSTNIEYDQFAQLHKGEVIVPKNFSDGLRAGDLSLGNNKELVDEIKNLINISIQGFNEFRKLRKEVEDIKEAM